MALVLNNQFYGIVGERTDKTINGTQVCIGDIVKVAAGDNNNECIGIVGVFTDKISVMGLGSTPISKLNIVEIVKSHKELSIGINACQYHWFEVREFKQ